MYSSKRSHFSSNLLLALLLIFIGSWFSPDIIIAQTAEEPDGIGTSFDPYRIETHGNLYWMSQHPEVWEMEFRVVANINMEESVNWDAGKGFSPIGNETTPFKGIFDGDGYFISNLYINRPEQDHIGLFGRVSSIGGLVTAQESEIFDVVLSNADITGRDYVGAVIGSNISDSETNLIVSGNVTGRDYVGGVTGENRGENSNNRSSNMVVTGRNYVGGVYGYHRSQTVSGLTSTATVTGVDYVGGCIGELNGNNTVPGEFLNSNATGNVTGINSVGGLIGRMEWSESEVINSYALGDVSGEINVGGLIGYLDAESVIDLGHAKGDVTGLTKVGGLVGFADDNTTIRESFATGAVEGDSEVGGFVGHLENNSLVVDSYSNGIVTGDDVVGGLVGRLEDSFIINSYTGNTIYGGTNTGGLVGINTNGSVSNSYWNSSTTWVTTSAGGTALTSSEMKSQSSFSGFIFGSTWSIDEGSSYPWLTDLEEKPNHPTVHKATGSGTETDPYLINELLDLFWVSQEPGVWGSYFKQTEDLDLSQTQNFFNGAGFSPIGNTTTAFTGSYDGDGHTLSNLFINRSSQDYVGLFGYTTRAEIYELDLSDVNITGKAFTGALTGHNYFESTINRVSVTGTVNGTTAVGGLAGQSSSLSVISNSNAQVAVNGTDKVGGLAGVNFNESMVTKSYSVSNVSGTADRVGVLIGENSGSSEINTSFANGEVQGNSEVGGLVGRNSTSAIANSYSQASVTGVNLIGGIAGYMVSGSISYSYTTGSINGSNNTGAFVGTSGSGVSISSSYWNSELSEQLVGIGTNNGNDTPLLLTNTAMKMQSNFSGWDFSLVWAINEGGTFPYLREATQLPYPSNIDPNGTGTAENPYLISTLNELIWLSENNSLFDKHFQQTANIDASSTSSLYGGSGFIPIGTNSNRFTGVYDGNGYSIEALTIYRSSSNEVGLFGAIENATIKNIRLPNLSITGWENIGGIAGRVFGSSEISDVTVSGSIVGKYNVGGIAGNLENYESSVTLSSVQADIDGEINVGGIAGSSFAELSEVYYSGNVSGDDVAGGLVGLNVNRITNSYATGSVSGGNTIGGLVGITDVFTKEYSISRSFAVAEVEGNTVVGGFIGVNKVSLEQVYFSSEFSGATDIRDHQANQQVTDLDKSELLLSESFSGLDFTNIWGIQEGGSIPYLVHLKPGFLQTVFPMEGTGQETDPFKVRNTRDLLWISGSTEVFDKHFMQIGSIDITFSEPTLYSQGFPSIGTEQYPFTGSFNGNGYEISNLSIQQPGNNFIGLFGYINNAELKNIELTNVHVRGANYVGALIGHSENSELSGIIIQGKVEGDIRIGGIVGRMVGGKLVNSSTAVSVTLNNTDAGGIIGYAESIEMDAVFATDTVKGGSSIGGLVGEIDNSEVKNSYFTGYLDGSLVGGLIAEVENSTIVDSYATSDLVSGTSAGGLVDRLNDSILRNVYATGQIIANEHAGGLLGITSNSTISDSYATGDVTSSGTNVGGFVGRLTLNSKVYRSEAYGNVTGAGTLGGFGGYVTESEIKSSMASGNVSKNAETSPYYGGFAGVVNRSIVLQSKASGNVEGVDQTGGFAGISFGSTFEWNSAEGDSVSGTEYVGGFLGNAFYSDPTIIKNSYTTSYVEGGYRIGGFAGLFQYPGGFIENSYSTGNVVGSESVGGFIGDLRGEASVINSFSTGQVQGLTNTGGFIGYLSTSPFVTNSYWDVESSGTVTGFGVNLNEQTVNALTTTQMKNPDNFNGWDFTTIWATDSETNHPFLQDYSLADLLITGGEGWRLLSSPIQEASFSTILDTLWTQGIPGADTENGSPNVFYWSEPSQSFIAPSNLSENPGAGVGYITYVYDDNNFDGEPDGFPKRLSVDGERFTGNKELILSYTSSENEANDGWNLIGNPYGTTIQWDSPDGLVKNNIDNVIYVWSDTTSNGNGDYLTWNGETGSLENGKIAPWQGFWVKAHANEPSITFSDTIRNANGVLLKELPIPKLQFQLTDGEMSSKATIMFHTNAKIEKDRFDAYKLESLNADYLSLSSSMDEQEAMDIQALPVNFEELKLDLNLLGSNLQGELKLNWEVKHIPDGWDLLLIDHVTQSFYNLKTEKNIDFEVNSTQKDKDRTKLKFRPNSPIHLVGKRKDLNSRFSLILTNSSATGSEYENELPGDFGLSQNYPNPFNPSTQIEYQLPVDARVSLIVYDMLGRQAAVLVNGQIMQAGYHSVTFNAANLASGMYIYRLQAGKTVIIKKLTLIK